jgi:hypothetical protein
MSEDFTTIGLEVYVNGAWVDIFPDLAHNPGLRVSGIGIMSNAPLDRVGGIGKLSFSLRNGEDNAAQTLGYYSPGHPNVLTGWTTGLPVHLFFLYDGYYKHLYFKIDPDGIEVTPFVTGARDVKVKCSNWMREAANRTIDLIAYQIALTANQGIAQVVDNMPFEPLEVSYQNGTRTFPTVFDVTSKKTKAISEINKLTLSEFGLCYVRGSKTLADTVAGETLVFENRTYRYANRTTPSTIPLHSSETPGFLLLETGDKVLLETGDKILLEASQDAIFSPSDLMELQTSYGRNIYNKATLTSYPRKIDASAVVLWNLEEPITLTAGQTVSNLRSSYRDPNGKSSSVSGINMIPPVATTDYTANSLSDGTGTDKTSSLTVSAEFGTAEVEYSLTNSATSTIYVTFLQFRGYGVYVYDTASVTHESATSISNFGVNELTVDMPYVSDATTLFSASNAADLMLLETGDYLLLENGNFLRYDDEAGVFGLLFSDVPATEINKAGFTANRDKLNMLAFMALDAGSSIKLTEPMNNIESDYTYYINGYDLELINNKIVKWSAVLAHSLTFPKV